MSGNLQKSSSLGRIVEDITHLKQRLEYFERHVHNVRDEEAKKSIFEHWLKFWKQRKPFAILKKSSIIVNRLCCS
ncbi:MAG: hypothetical protein QN720_10610 [Nitrososphaeraceae archaeon]|nr:hypothetical protein [Nitrososphaeraceae archaeon]